MANPIVKSKATDFSGYYNGNGFFTRVLALSLSVTPTKMSGGGEGDDVINAHFDGEPSAGDLTTYDTAVTDYALECAKNKKIKAINDKTDELISAGFVSSSKTFSLSTEAQAKWRGYEARKATLTYAFDVLTIDDSEYVSIADQAAVTAHFNDMEDTILGHVDSGAAYKKQVIDATTITAVEAVNDTR